MEDNNNTPILPERTLIGAALAVAPAAIGAGVGVLLGQGLKRRSREGVAVALFALGAAAAVPATLDYVKRVANAPRTQRGSSRRLSAIRYDVPLEDEEGAAVIDQPEAFRQEA